MNRKKFLFYGRLWGIMVGGALVAGLILALITWLNRGGDVRRMIWYMLAVDCMMTGYFCLQILPISTYMSTVPLMLASGCRRKEVILSSQILKFLNFLGILAVTAIFLLLQSRMKGNQVEIQRMKDMFLMSALLLLSGGSVGNLIGVLYNLIGRWVMILYVKRSYRRYGGSGYGTFFDSRHQYLWRSAGKYHLPDSCLCGSAGFHRSGSHCFLAGIETDGSPLLR